MNLMVMAYVSDMERSVAFYESLGLSRRDHGEVDPMWNEFMIGDATFALHRVDRGDIAPAGDHLSLNLQVAPGELDRLFATCEELGYPIGAPIRTSASVAFSGSPIPTVSRRSSTSMQADRPQKDGAQRYTLGASEEVWTQWRRMWRSLSRSQQRAISWLC